MRILFLTAISINTENLGTHLYNGCGWIGSLIKSINDNPDIQVGVSFFSRSIPSHKKDVDGVSFYVNNDPISSKLAVLKSVFKSDASYDEKRLDILENIIIDFKPDIIQVFGTEDFLGLIAERTQVPVVIHIQGIINPCLNAMLPPGFSWREYFGIGHTLKHKFLRLFDRTKWNYYAERETQIFKHCNYYIGRTDWDYKITKLYNNEAKYFHCWEILRTPFYEKSKRIIPEKLVLTSTISNASYKGFDVILKTAKVLKEFYNLDFEWHIYGNINSYFYEKKMNLFSKDLNILLHGVASPENIKQQILTSTAFVHLSYIDNSSNSICEAMILGCPIISTFVGGLTTLVQDKKTGFLVPANDPLSTAVSILLLHNDKEMNIDMGNQAQKVAMERHDINSISNMMYTIYEKIIQ